MTNLLLFSSPPAKNPLAFEQQYTAATSRETATIVPSTAQQNVPVGDEDFKTVGRGGRAMQFSAESIYKHLQAIREARGKKVTIFDGLSRCGEQPEHIPIEH